MIYYVFVDVVRAIAPDAKFDNEGICPEEKFYDEVITETTVSNSIDL